MEKISIIGAGSLGFALGKGLVKSGQYKPADIFFTKRNSKNIELLTGEGFLASTQNSDALKHANIIVLAVLPQQVNTVLDEIKAQLSPNHLLISLVTGIEIAQIEKHINNVCPVIRSMPNTAIAISESMTCIAANEKSQSHLASVKQLFELVGEVIVIIESQMTSATALCACGIAFFLRAIRAASQGGIEVDFHAEEALKMAAQTAKGAASLLLANNTHPEEEIDKVTSPKGCTIAGLNQMEHNGFSSAFIKGITTSAKKAGGLYPEE